MKITIKEAARMLNKSEQFVRVGLQQGILPIGVAVKMSSRWSYHISPGRLFKYLGTREEDKKCQ